MTIASIFTRHPRIDDEYLWPFAIFIGIALGLYEGSIYTPPANHLVFWAIMFVLLAVPILLAVGYLYAVPMFLVSLVFQDAASLIAQGQSPATATWYTAFAPSWLHWAFNHVLVVPLFYFLLPLTALAMEHIIDIYEGREPPS